MTIDLMPSYMLCKYSVSLSLKICCVFCCKLIGPQFSVSVFVASTVGIISKTLFTQTNACEYFPCLLLQDSQIWVFQISLIHFEVIAVISERWEFDFILLHIDTGFPAELTEKTALSLLCVLGDFCHKSVSSQCRGLLDFLCSHFVCFSSFVLKKSCCFS